MISALLQTLANFGFDVTALNAAFNSALSAIQVGSGGLGSLGSEGLKGILGQNAMTVFSQGGLIDTLSQSFSNLTGLDDTSKSIIISAMIDAVTSIVGSGSAQAAVNAIVGA